MNPTALTRRRSKVACMESPVVGVLELSKRDLEMIKGGASDIKLGGDLQAKLAEIHVDGLLDALKEKSEGAVVLNWKGGKIPRGVQINGKEIGWTQNGVVTSVDGEMLGTYDRLLEFGGENHDEQCMVVFKHK